MSLKAKREQRAKLTADVRAIKDKADQEKRKLTVLEIEQSEKILDEIDKLNGEIRELEREETVERRTREAIELDGRGTGRRTDPGQPGQDGRRRANISPEQRAEQREEYRDAFGAFLRRGIAGVSEEQRTLLMEAQQDLPPEVRDQGVGTGAAGGFTVAPLFQAQMSEAMKAFQGVRIAGAEHITGSMGQDLPFPSNDDTANAGSIVTEAGAVGAGTDLTFAQTIVGTHMYTSGVVKVSLQLLQDSAFNIEQYLSGKLAERIGRITNTHWTNGTGTGQPRGIVTAVNGGAGIGVTAAAANAITADELLALQHTVDPAYRNTGRCRYAFSDGILRIIRGLKDGQGRYLLNEPTNGAPATVWGMPFSIFTEMAAAPATGLVTALFGDFSHYKTREVTGMGVVRLDQLYMANLQIGFLAYGRFGGNYVNPGNFTVKCLKQP